MTRRDVLDDARRKVERALMVSPIAEELALASEKVIATGSEDALVELRAALERYRAVNPVDEAPTRP